MSLTDEDKQRLAAIVDADSATETAVYIHTYYRDVDRADRTPRHVLYIHLGMLVGCILRADRSN